MLERQIDFQITLRRDPRVTGLRTRHGQHQTFSDFQPSSSNFFLKLSFKNQKSHFNFEYFTDRQNCTCHLSSRLTHFFLLSLRIQINGKIIRNLNLITAMIVRTFETLPFIHTTIFFADNNNITFFSSEEMVTFSIFLLLTKWGNLSPLTYSLDRTNTYLLTHRPKARSKADL